MASYVAIQGRRVEGTRGVNEKYWANEARAPRVRTRHRRDGWCCNGNANASVNVQMRQTRRGRLDAYAVQLVVRCVKGMGMPIGGHMSRPMGGMGVPPMGAPPSTGAWPLPQAIP